MAAELVIKCINGTTFSEFQLAANFFFENTFHGWFDGDHVTYLIPPIFRCKSEGYVIQSGLNDGVTGNIVGDENELDFYTALQTLKTGPKIAFHSFSLRERLKTYNKLLLPYYQHRRNPYEIHAKEILRHIDENSRREDAECDFMMFDKKYGVFLFEVKTSIKGRLDAKTQLDVDNNFVKALIENGLAEAGFTNAWELAESVPIHLFSVFPAVTRPECSDKNEIFTEDLRSFNAWWRRNIRNCKSVSRHHDYNVEYVMTVLAARFVAMASASPITINEAIANLGDTLTNQTFGKLSKKYHFMFFTPMQDSILHHGTEKLVLEGPPGCGKSVIIMYKCLELVKAKEQEILEQKHFKKSLIICGYKAIGLKAMHKEFMSMHFGNHYSDFVDVYTKKELDEIYGDPLLIFRGGDDRRLTDIYCDLFIDELQSVIVSLAVPTDATELLESVTRSFHFVWLSVDPLQTKHEAAISLAFDENIWTVSKLTHTLRNTENISREVSNFIEHQRNARITSGHRIKGLSPDWINVRQSLEEESHVHLIGIVRQLVERGNRTLKMLTKEWTTKILSLGNLNHNDVLIFWNTDNQTKMSQLVDILRNSNIPASMLSPSYSPHDDQVTVANDVEEILSMEFRVVIAMFVQYGREYEEKDFIVPVSRAMCHLIILRNIEQQR